MALLFSTLLVFIATGMVSLHFFTRLRRVKVASTRSLASLPASNRYQPMLRLLSADDEALVASNKVLARKLKKQRIELFRGYLACLSADYGQLLAGLRLVMVRSEVNRPDLASALAKNQILFTLAVCRIEYRLFLHTFGLGSVDVSGLVGAITALRNQVSVFTPAMAGAR